VNPSQLEILQHSLGCDRFGKSNTPLSDEGDGCFGHYRNRYVTDPKSTCGIAISELVSLGLMRDHGPQAMAAGMHYYSVTQAGLLAMWENSPKPPKLTRSQKRFARYCEVADCFSSFRDFLKYEQAKK